MSLIFSIFIWVLIILLAIYLLGLIRKTILINYYVHKFPGPPMNNLIVGNCKPLIENLDDFAKITNKWSLEYYPAFKVWLGPVASVIIINPDDLELILTNVKHNEKSPVYRILKNWLRTGLLTSAGDKWQQRRKMLTPTFHFNILQQFLLTFRQHAKSLVEVLDRECGKPETEVFSIISKSAIDIIGETAMGINFESNPIAGDKYKYAVHKMSEISLYKFIRPIYYMNRFCDLLYFFTPTYWTERKYLKSLHEFTKNVIAEKEKTFKGVPKFEDEEETNLYLKKKRLAMMDLLLSLKKEGLIDDDGITEEVDTFMFEGHDTVSSAISFCLMLLANFRNYQEEIIQEMGDVMGNICKEPSFNDLQELKIMERVIKESLRLYPSVFYISRILGEDIVTSTGLKLPKNTAMHLFIAEMHRNPNVYPEPNKFDPDRFLPENTKTRHPFAFLPFSAGPRNCIGQRFAMMEMKTILCAILSNFILEPIDTPETVHVLFHVILRTKEGLKVKFVRRNDKNSSNNNL